MESSLCRKLPQLKDRSLLPYLSAYTRQLSEQGVIAKLTEDNWEDCARAHMTTSVQTKTFKLLKLFEKRSLHRPGTLVEIKREVDYPLLDAGSAEELDFFLNWGVEQKLIDYPTRAADAACLTVKGWTQLEPQGREGIPGLCFVAMSFDASLTEAYTMGIAEAIRGCGCEPIMLKEVEHNEKICDKIIADIRRCQFVVADVTGQNPGAYFEAGFAMALGRPVIWTCREDEKECLHFDTRQYPHIFWETPEELRQKLVDRIQATIKTE
jgi:hypothetical protein